MEAFIGLIAMYGFNWAPRNWALCNGQLLPISQNTALFSLLGTTFGGDGRTTFALPNLQGRVPMGFGTGAGLSAHPFGQAGGRENMTLDVTHLASHTHVATATSTATSRVTGETVAPTSLNPNNRIFAQTQIYADPDPKEDKIMHPQTCVTTVDTTVQVENAGGGAAFSIEQPYLAVNYSICMEGIYPSRN